MVKTINLNLTTVIAFKSGLKANIYHEDSFQVAEMIDEAKVGGFDSAIVPTKQIVDDFGTPKLKEFNLKNVGKIVSVITYSYPEGESEPREVASYVYE